MIMILRHGHLLEARAGGVDEDPGIVSDFLCCLPARPAQMADDACSRVMLSESSAQHLGRVRLTLTKKHTLYVTFLWFNALHCAGWSVYANPDHSTNSSRLTFVSPSGIKMRSIKDVERVIQETASSPRIPMKGAVIEAEMEDPHENRLEWVQGIITKVLPKNAGFKVSFKVENADERGVWEEKYQVPPNSLPTCPRTLPTCPRVPFTCPRVSGVLRFSLNFIPPLTLSGCFFAPSRAAFSRYQSSYSLDGV